MKKILLVITLITTSITPVYADVYVKVDANGNAIDGAIVCDAVTCGADSLYSKLTLKEGERYVLQGYGQSGIGNNNPDTQVKVDNTNTWTVTTPTSVSTFVPTREPVYVAPIAPVISETTTATSDTATVVTDSATTTVTIDSATVTTTTTDADVMTLIYALLEKIMTLLARLKG